WAEVGPLSGKDPLINRNLRTQACLADFRCLTEASSGSPPSVLLPLNRCQLFDEFACPARFPWHTVKNVIRDPTLVADDFNAQDYATLVAHPSSFRKFPEEFLCLFGLSCHYTLDEETYPSFVEKDREDMDIFAFIRTTDPTKVKVAKRERREYELRLLEITVGRTVPLLPVAPDHGESELDASVDKLFDEGGSGTQVEQGDSVGDGDGQDTVIQPFTVTTNTVAEDVILLQPRGGKSRSAVQQLFARAVQNAEVRGEPLPTLPFATSSVFAKPERKDEGHTDSVTRLNLRTISAPQRPSIPVITSATTVTSTADPAMVVKEKVVKPSFFAVDSSSAGGADPNAGIFSDLTESDFLVSGVRTVIDPDTDLQKVYVPRWSVTNGSHLSLDAARQMSLSAEVRMCTEYKIKEKRRLRSTVDKKDELLKVREREIENLKAQLLLKEAEAAKAIRLRAEAYKFEAIEKSLQVEVEALNEHNTTLEKKKNELDVKVVDLAASVKVREQEVADLDAVVAFVKSQNDNLMNQLAVAKCLNSSEYLSALGAAIGKAIEKGMQDRLAAGITHGKEGRVLADVAAYNPSAEVDYVSALQQLQSVNFSLLTELKLNKDSSVETLMNILRLEETLAERLDVSHARVQKIKENIANHISTLYDIFIPLAEPFFAVDLEGTRGTSKTVPATADTTTALSTTLASASTIIPISVDDYDVACTDNQAAVNENVASDNATSGDVNPFPNVDDTELNVPE
ncbi:hypothetical protein Tco_0815802, partial [Tanacetum coccineum]